VAISCFVARILCLKTKNDKPKNILLKSSLSLRRERVRVRGRKSPPPLSSPLEGGGNLEQVNSF
jgi:hypothetical protein